MKRTTALLPILFLLFSTARADELVVFAPDKPCPQPLGAGLSGKHTLREILEKQSKASCSVFFAPKRLLDREVEIELPKDISSRVLAERMVRDAIQHAGLRADFRPAFQIGDQAPFVAAAPVFTLPPSRPSAVPITPGMLDAAIHRDGNHCTIDRKIYDALIASPVDSAMSARIVPTFKDGKPNGFKLFAIRPNGVFARLGFQNGDTVHSVNGFPLDTADEALEAYTKLRGAGHVTVAVERIGKPITLEYTIK